MKMNIFAKSVKKSDGSSFVRYIGKLYDKNGLEYNVTIKFKDIAPPAQKDCPMEINVKKEGSQLSQKRERNAVTGDDIVYYTLWTNNWERIGDYIDHSLDDFED